MLIAEGKVRLGLQYYLELSFVLNAQVFKTKEPLVHTFSIVARDEATGEMSVGVQSHWFSVGTAVPWAEAGVGAVATQSFVDKSYGPKALALLKQGYTAQQALDSLTKVDAGRDVRQVAIIDTKGNIAAHTGAKCIQFASHIKGTNFSVQSNMMLGNTVCESMKAAFEKSTGKPLAERVLLALEAAQKAGGDIRGMQSAALITVPGKTIESCAAKGSQACILAIWEKLSEKHEGSIELTKAFFNTQGYVFNISVEYHGEKMDFIIKPLHNIDQILYEVHRNGLFCVVGLNYKANWDSDRFIDNHLTYEIGKAIDKAENN